MQLKASPQSIAAAKAAMYRDRRQVYQQTGIYIAKDGRIAKGPVLIACVKAGCRHVASARTEGRALRALATHIVAAHPVQES